MSERPLVPAPLARGTHGAVVAPHHLATAAGLGVLRAGGSAVDAAIATNAVLAVVVPAELRHRWRRVLADLGRVVAVVSSPSTVPAGARPRSTRRGCVPTGHERVPFRGPMSITVPGAVRSWGDAHARYGRLSRDAVLAPAIELARDGFAASDDFVARRRGDGAARAREAVDGDGFDRVFRPHGRAWRPGERVRLPALATTLETLARDGFDAFYDGDIGDRQATDARRRRLRS